MKKIISTALALAVLLSSVSALARVNTEKMQEVLISVKERIGSTDSYPQFSSSERKTNQGTAYSFNWSNQGEHDWSELNVSANDEGIITSYNTYSSEKEPADSQLSINRPKKAEALIAAQKAIDKLNPSLAGEIIAEDTNGYENFRRGSYGFRVQRYKNGIPVHSDSGWVNLNSSLELKSFSISYTTGFTFGEAENTISNKEAQAAYNQHIGTKLYYIFTYEHNKKAPAVKLVYAPTEDYSYIHAVTGEKVTIEPYSAILNSTESFDQEASGGGSNGSLKQDFTQAELKNLQEIEGLISLEAADQSARSYEFFGISDDFSIRSSSLYYNEYKNSYFYSLYYINADKLSIRLTINAKTGEIISFSNWKDNFDEEGTPDPAKITELSEEIAGVLAKDKLKEFKKEEGNPADNGITYTRYINEIPFYENTISMSFNKDYSLSSYNITYDDIDFPKPENIISPQDAFKYISDLGEYKVYYVADHKEKIFVPVYKLTEAKSVDAFTGKSIYEDSSKQGGIYTDISGHWAEDEIKTLAEYGIFFEGTQLNPDTPITQFEYISLLSILFYNNSVSCLRDAYYDDIYNSVPQEFLKDDTNFDAPLTRERAAMLMVRAMGIEEYASLTNIYKPLYEDVLENIGAINILTGLGVLSGDGTGNFNPNSRLTKAESLMMIYNYLSR